ncbi:hypothetical protein GCM10027028_34790 [Streptomyces sundarbansensis]
MSSHQFADGDAVRAGCGFCPSGVDAAAGVSADQCRPSQPQSLGELGQGESGGFDVVRGGVGACVAGPQQRGTRFAEFGLAVVDERAEGVVTEGLPPGRGDVLFVGLCGS